MFTSTKTSHLLILQEIRALKNEVAEINREIAEQQTAQFMAEIDELKAQLDEMRSRWTPPVIARVPTERPADEIRAAKVFNSQSRQ